MVTQQKKFRTFLRSPRLLPTTPPVDAYSGSVLLRHLRKTSAAYWIVNVSGCAARLRPVGSNAASNMKRRGVGVPAR